MPLPQINNIQELNYFNSKGWIAVSISKSPAVDELNFFKDGNVWFGISGELPNHATAADKLISTDTSMPTGIYSVTASDSFITSDFSDIPFFPVILDSFSFEDIAVKNNEFSELLQSILRHNDICKRGFERISQDILSAQDNFILSNKFNKRLSLNLSLKNDKCSSIANQYFTFLERYQFHEKLGVGFPKTSSDNFNLSEQALSDIAICLIETLLLTINKAKLNNIICNLKSQTNLRLDEKNFLSKIFLDTLSDNTNFNITNYFDAITLQYLKDFILLSSQTKSNWTTNSLAADIYNINELISTLRGVDTYISDNLPMSDISKLVVKLILEIYDSSNFIDNIPYFLGVFKKVLSTVLTSDTSYPKANISLTQRENVVLGENGFLILTTQRSLAEIFSTNDTLKEILAKIGYLTDTLTSSDITRLTGNYREFVTNIFGVKHTDFANTFSTTSVLDILNFDIKIVIDGEVYQCWVLNTNDLLPSIYTNYIFNSYTVLDNNVFAASDDGIYQIGINDTDEGAKIKTGVKIQTDTFASQYSKRLRLASFGVYAGKPMIRIYTEESDKYTYYAINGRVDIGKGLSGKIWTLEIVDIDSLTFVELYPMILSK